MPIENENDRRCPPKASRAHSPFRPHRWPNRVRGKNLKFPVGRSLRHPFTQLSDTHNRQAVTKRSAGNDESSFTFPFVIRFRHASIAGCSPTAYRSSKKPNRLSAAPLPNRSAYETKSFKSFMSDRK